MKSNERIAKDGDVSIYVSWKNQKSDMSVLIPILSRLYKTYRHLITYQILQSDSHPSNGIV